MKRYWKLISTVIIIVLVVGAFYIQSSMATNKYPEFVLEKKSGDAKIAQQLTLKGDYSSGYDIVLGGNSVDITTDGSTFSGERSFFERIKGINRDPEINRLQQDYRNFMRGKGEDPVLFTENKSILAYANIKSEFHDGYQRTDFSFDMQVLEKEKNDKTSVTAAVPKSELYNFIYVEAVYIAGGEVKVVTNNRVDNNGEPEGAEMHLYSFDLDTKKIVGNQTIIAGSEPQVSNQWLDIRVLSGYEDLVSNNENIAFVKNVVAEDMESNQSQTMEQHLVVYNLETNQKEKLDLPEELQQGYNVDSIHGTTIYFSKIVDDQLEITSYDIESKQIEKKQTFALPKTKGTMEGENNLLINIKDDKAYIVSSYQEKMNAITVADLNSGEIVYEGTIGMKDKSNDREDYQLYIHELVVDGESRYND